MINIKSIEEYNGLINQGKKVLLDFYADWCGPCRTQLPILEGFANKFGDNVIVAKVNVDTQGELARQFRVRSIPTIAVVENGLVQYQQAGLHSEQKLIELIGVQAKGTS